MTQPDAPLLAADIRAMASCPPPTKAGQIRWLLPEIEAAVRAGHRLKEICRVLNDRGLAISYPDFRTVLYRIRKRHNPTAATPAAERNTATTHAEPATSSVLDEIRRQREKRERTGFHHTPFTSDHDLV